MAHDVAVDDATTRHARGAGVVAIAAVAAASAAFVVWFTGFDLFWAFAAMVGVATLAGVISTLRPDEAAPWDAPARETPRGTRLAVTLIEQSLAACDRLARPTSIRRLRALLIPERDDHHSRSRIVREMRALLVAELHDRGIDPSDRMDDVVALLGPDALTILQPHDDRAITSAGIERCLDAIERLATTTPGSR